MSSPHEPPPPALDPVTRRAFLKGASLTVAAVGIAGPGARPARAAGVAADAPAILGPGPVPFELRVNGVAREVIATPATTLVDALRDTLGLTGTKRVCDRGACGACTVMLDGRVVDSCSMLAIDAVGREITTVEGCGTPDALSPVQEAFVACDALQCGYCTPGMVVACTELVRRVPRPSRAEVAEAISGNICRCGTYANIFEAVARATREGGGRAR